MGSIKVAAAPGVPVVRLAHAPRLAAYPPGMVLAERRNPDHELVWVVEGEADVVVAGGPPVTLLPGSVLLLGPGTAHEIRWGGAGGCVHGYVHFHADPPLATDAVLRRPSPSDPVTALCRYLEWAGTGRPPDWRGWAEQVVALAVGLLAGAPAPDPGPPLDERWPPTVRALLAELRHRWAVLPLDAVRVHTLASGLAVSRTHLNRSTVRHLGRPVSTLCEQLRLVRAEDMLSGTSATLATIAANCGFADAFHLSRRFSHHVGTPPSAFRTSRVRVSLLDDPVLGAAAAAVWGR